MTEVVLAVHGGAGSLDRGLLAGESREDTEAGLRRALELGRAALRSGADAVSAVVAAVRCLEDDPLFNAGRGAVLCADGSAELAASVMCGRTRRAGAVAAARRLRNPVSGAAALLDHQHVMLIGAAADGFGESAGCELADPAYFVTERRHEHWRRRVESGGGTERQDAGGTVGAVAHDQHGHLAAATSTGGMILQLPGRVGDSPCIGAGTWADDRTCAVSATGHGEVFMRAGFAHRVADLVELARLPVDEAARWALAEVRDLGGHGGCIAVDSRGQLALPFNSPHMPRGWVVGDAEPEVAIAATP